MVVTAAAMVEATEEEERAAVATVAVTVAAARAAAATAVATAGDESNEVEYDMIDGDASGDDTEGRGARCSTVTQPENST